MGNDRSSAYAIAADSGATHVVLVNSSATTAWNTTVDLGAKTQKANVVTLTGRRWKAPTAPGSSLV